MTEQRIRIFKLIEGLPDSALDELEIDLATYREIYTEQDNYKPEPIPEPIAPKVDDTL